MDNAPKTAAASHEASQAAIKALVAAAAAAAIAIGFSLPVSHSKAEPRSQFSELNISGR